MAPLASTVGCMSKLQYLWQWALLICCVLPLLLLTVIVSIPVAMLIWATGVDVMGRRMAAKRDPALARAMQVEAKEHQSPLMFRLAALRLVHITIMIFWFSQGNFSVSKVVGFQGWLIRSSSHLTTISKTPLLVPAGPASVCFAGQAQSRVWGILGELSPDEEVLLCRHQGAAEPCWPAGKHVSVTYT